jgi:membrane protein implicated in regulation of membrane protease activity
MPPPSAKDPQLKSNTLPRSEDGFTAGLKFWLVFLIALVLLGFPLAYAIVFGAIAGIAGGFAVGWWQELSLKPGVSSYSDVFAAIDSQRLMTLDESESDNYDRGESLLRRRAKYVSNRPYDRDNRKRTMNSWLSWRLSSRPTSDRQGKRY